MPLEDTLELDISEAMASVDRLGAGLTQAAQSFGVELAASLDSLREPVPVTADASAVTAEVEAALAAAEVMVQPEADAAAVTDAVTAAVDEADTVAVVEADTSGFADEIESAAAGVEVVIPVEADTSQAQAEIEELGAVAAGASGGVGQLGGGVGALGAISAAAVGDVTNLTGGLGKLGAGNPAMVGVVGGLAAVGAAAGVFVTKALDARDSADTFRIAVGDMADEVSTIDIGGLNTDLESLAVALGHDDEAAFNAASRIFSLGKASGIAADEVANTTVQIEALAARAVALNPSLGEMGTVAEGLVNALARGGRAGTAFGISLTTTEIATRAMADTGKATAAELTIFEKATAGAALATEALGAELGADIQSRIETTATGFARLRSEFENVLETAGEPLLDPLLDALEMGTPLAAQLAGGLGELAASLLPIAIDLLPLATGAVRGLSLGVEVAVPVLDVLAGILDSVPTPLLEAVGAFLLFRHALGPIPGMVSALLAKLTAGGGIGGALSGAGTAASGFGAAIGAMNPLMLAGGLALTGLTLAVSSHAKSRREEKERIEAASSALADNTDTVQGNTRALLENVLAERNQLDDLKRLSLTFEEFTGLVLEGSEGLATFLDNALRAGEIKIIDDTTRQTFSSVQAMIDQYGSLDEAMHNVIITGNEGLVDTFRQQQGAAQDAAAKILDAAIASDDYTQAQVDAAIAQTKFADGSENAAGALDLLRGGAEGAAAAAGDLSGAGEKTAGVLGTTADSAQEAADKMRALRSAMDELLGVMVGAEQAGIGYERALDSAQGAAVTMFEAQVALNEAIRDHGIESKEAADATEVLSDAELALRDANLGTFNAARDVTDALAKQTDALKGAGPEAAALRDELVAMREKMPELRNEIDKYIGRIDAMTTPDFKMEEGVAKAHEAIRTASPGFLNAGQAVGRDFSDGVARGILARAAVIGDAAFTAAQRADRGARRALREESPSKVGLDIGSNFAQAVAAGIESGSAEAVLAAAAMGVEVSDAIRAEIENALFADWVAGGAFEGRRLAISLPGVTETQEAENLFDVLRAGNLTVEAWVGLLDATGLSMEQLLGIQKDLNAEVLTFSSQMVSAFGSVEDATASLTAETSLADFMADANEQVRQTLELERQLNIIRRRGADDLAAALASQGANAAQAIADAVALDPAVLRAQEQEFERLLAINERNAERAQNLARQLVATVDSPEVTRAAMDASAKLGERTADALAWGIASHGGAVREAVQGLFEVALEGALEEAVDRMAHLG